MNKNLEILKKLRAKTSLGMSDCKKALEEVGYDYDKALTYLREKGSYAASAKSGRTTSQGLIGVKDNGKKVSMIELRCETDFVANGDIFTDLLDSLLDIALEKNFESIKQFQNIKEVKDKIANTIAKVGENINLEKAFSKNSSNEVQYYIHNSAPNKKNLGQIASIVMFKTDKKNSDIENIIHKIAMHSAACFPRYVNKSDVPESVIEEEKRIYTEQIKSSNKPDHVIEKIVDGKIAKFLQDCVLLEQNFVMDNNLKIKDFIKAESKKMNTDLNITDIIVLKLGN